ncbi:DEAD-box helicase family protein [Medicago truncatula]|uniref:DEAD-box helicase family protein n=1 Tax=Medicago truncatula TaxID=3880 RepID=A0A072V632_MEDTR|nr:DEAD-box helicase family protein [Medicago truncatula]
MEKIGLGVLGLDKRAGSGSNIQSALTRCREVQVLRLVILNTAARKTSPELFTGRLKQLVTENMEEENKEMKSFKDLGLSEQLVEACEKIGWKNPKEIQTEVIPLALQGKDVIGISNTSSGKTGAFVLPILHALALQPCTP